MKTLLRSPLLALSAALFVLSGCKSTSESQGHWSYEGDTGPAYWSELSSDYQLAATGREQSPIDITAGAVSVGGGNVMIDCNSTIVNLVNNGHSIQANVEPGATLKTPTGDYELKQFHFHSPSEHTYDGEHAEMEMHLVHANDNGQLAVVGVMIEEGAENKFFSVLWPNIPAEAGGSTALTGLTFGPADILPTSRATYRYSGSLTTPPCSEGVDWTMMQTPITASSEQVAAFRQVMYHNNRPTQPLNGRTVKSGN
jgi:carbonic anhydrase